MKKISLAVFALLAFALLGAGCAPSYQAPVAPTPQTGTPVINSNTEYFPPTNTNTGTPSANINAVVPTNTNVTPPPPPANVNQPAATVMTVDIRNYSFNPAELTVAVGTTVKWANYDPFNHQIAGTGFGSNALPQGGEYSFTFNQAGTYDYHCAIHPYMIGKIIVK